MQQMWQPHRDLIESLLQPLLHVIQFTLPVSVTLSQLGRQYCAAVLLSLLQLLLGTNDFLLQWGIICLRVTLYLIKSGFHNTIENLRCWQHDRSKLCKELHLRAGILHRDL